MMRPLSMLFVCLVTGFGVSSAEPIAPVRLLPIGSGYSANPVNVLASRRHALFTHGSQQFAAYYDAQRFIVLARRELGTDQWQTQRTRERGNPADANDSIHLAVDGAGFLHLTWDHGQALKYTRSRKPLSFELDKRQRLTSSAQQRITEPEFHLLPDGDLLLLYRDAASSQGRIALNRYRTSQKRWESVHSNLIDGEGARSAYWSAVVDGRGSLHLAWTWRDRADEASSHDIAHAYSPDGGMSWQSLTGDVRSPPFVASTADYAVHIPTQRSLASSPWITVDWHDQPYIMSYWSEAADRPPQFRYLRRDGSSWVAEQITQHSDALAGTQSQRAVSRGVFLVEGGPRVKVPPAHLIYRDAGHGGRVTMLSTPSVGSGQWTEHVLTRDSLDAWEPVIDPVQWQRLRQIHLLAQNVAQPDGKGATRPPTSVGSLIVSPREIRIATAPPREAATRAPLDAQITRAQAIDVMKRVADWQLAHPSERDPRGWEVAPFYIGTLALYRVSGDQRYRDAMLAQGNANQWQPAARVYHADDHAVVQAYAELFKDTRDPSILGASRARFDEILAAPITAPLRWNGPYAKQRWDWCDALFMAPASWLMMWQATGDARYLDFMNREWWISTEHLYSPKAAWYFRDESFKDQREPNGSNVYWSRGNGWVVAGLARVLDLFPLEHPDRKRYEDLYRQMMKAVLATQQPDGMWRAGLLDPQAHTAREVTGTSFMTFALAWGVNRGFLSRSEVEPAVLLAWRALNASVQPDGKLLDCQPIGDAPLGFDPSHTEPFGVGAFLLAGSEVANMIATPRP